MLKNIRLHIDKDEESQTQVERVTAARIESQFKSNMHAFRTFIPSLLDQINAIRNDNISIFCNKNGQFNIVDYGVGRTFYNLEPDEEIYAQYKVNTQHAISVSMVSDEEISKRDSDVGEPLEQMLENRRFSNRKALPESIETLVVLGVGLGYHIVELLSNYDIENLVIYEPEQQYFKCSAYCNQWDKALATASQKGTRLFFQIGRDGRNLVSDLEELKQHFKFNTFYLYKHYNTAVFNNIEKACASLDWAKIKRSEISVHTTSSATNYIPTWTSVPDFKRYKSPSHQSISRREKNLNAFKKYFPSIYKTFSDYEAQAWLPVEGDNNEINLIHKETLVAWYGNEPREECILNFNNFREQPNKDGLILGYQGKKLKKYLHYQFVNKTEALLKEVEEEEGALPDTIKSLILFGVGVGYQIETMFNEHDIDKLFICEPNRDFFNASLYAIDWAEILTKIDAKEGRLYINIGDDGTNLFRDLLNQFYSIGPYILANTYFYQSYYNSVLASAIAQLREQLQVVIAMGEYFDHARFGISQTTEMLDRHTPFMRKSPSQYLSFEDKEVPVFIIGNGPSLDDAIDAIKEWREHAIVISCGTALSALHKSGITPDFHAEIEQNRSTFDWCCRVDDFEYLKRISLISVNGIHPDTCDLFKDVFIAFKDGESSTVSALELLGREHYEELRFAFPTVSNLAVNLFSKLGMQQLYLFGVDLGFFNKSNHHSKNSSYYIDGKEVYDYEAANNTSIVVPGNFRKTVFTKYEFKLSKTIIEQSLASSSLACFNCSDGAKIAGAVPLRPDMVLVTSTPTQCSNALASIKNNAFAAFEKKESYSDTFYKRFGLSALDRELSTFIDKAREPFSSIASVDNFIQTQKELVFASYKGKKSLLFYLLYGTVNYANALLSKLASTTHNLEVLEKTRNEWLSTLIDIKESYLNHVTAFDVASSCVHNRESVFLRLWAKAKNAIFSAVVEAGYECLDTFIQEYAVQDSGTGHEVPTHYQLAFSEQANVSGVDTSGFDYTLIGSYSLFDNRATDIAATSVSKASYFVWYLPSAFDSSLFLSGDMPYIHSSRQHFVAGFLCNMDDVFMFLPKYEFMDSSMEQKARYLKPLLDSLSWVDSYVEYARYIAIPRAGVDVNTLECDNIGSRGKVFHGNIQLTSLLLEDLNAVTAKQLLEKNQNITV